MRQQLQRKWFWEKQKKNYQRYSNGYLYDSIDSYVGIVSVFRLQYSKAPCDISTREVGRITLTSLELPNIIKQKKNINYPHDITSYLHNHIHINME